MIEGNASNYTSSFVVVKHSWRGKYLRVFSIGSEKAVTMDLRGLFRITNSWDLVNTAVTVQPDATNSSQFSVTAAVAGKQNTMIFSCVRPQERMELLTYAHRSRMLNDKSSGKVFDAERYNVGAGFTCTRLRVTRVGIEEIDDQNNSIRLLLFMHIKGYTTVTGHDERLVIAYGSQLKLYMYQMQGGIREFVQLVNSNSALYVGIGAMEKLAPMSQEQFESDRIGLRNDALESVAEYPVTYLSKKGNGDGLIRMLLCVTPNAVVERHVDNYLPVRASLLLNIYCLVRCADDDQKFIVEYKEPHTTHAFVSPMRDAILGHLCSAARLCENEDVAIVSQLKTRPHRFGMLRYPISDEVESSLLYYVAHPEKMEDIRAPNVSLAVEYFNANVSYSGLRFAENKEGIFSENRERSIQDALYSVLSNYPLINKPEVVANRFSCLRRLCLARAGFGMVANSTSVFGMVSRILLAALRQDEHEVLREAIDFVSVLVVSHHDHYELRHEVTNKTNILNIPGFIPSLLSIFRRLIYDESKITVLQSLLTFFVYIICPPYSETTPSYLFTKTVNELVDNIGKELFWLLDSSCVDIQLNAARLIRTIIEEGDENQFKFLQGCAISEGGFLQQFHIAAFSKSIEQRDLARCLISYWAYNNTKIQDLLRRMIPIALLILLQSNETAEEDELERKAQRTYEEATDAYREKRQTWIERALKQAPLRREELAESPLVLRRRNIRVRPSLNWPLFFNRLKKDHRRPDLIWNHATRTELRHAIEKEIAFLRSNASQRSSTQKIAWNYLEFEVVYSSLESEVRIGDHYPRLLFENDEPEISRPKDFFNDLYHRFLLAIESKEKLFCLQGMTILCKHYGDVIGHFHDIPYFVSMLRESTDPLFRDSLIDFFTQLLSARHNFKRFIDSDGPAVLADLLPLAHLHVDRPKSYVVTNAIEGASSTDAQSSEEEWYYTIEEERHGPFSYAKIKKDFESGVISGSTKMWAQGLAGWKEMAEVPQLKWGVLCGKKASILTFSELTCRVLDIFTRLCEFYPSMDENGAVMSPLPKIKRFLTGSMVLPHVVQLLLTFDASICSRVHALLYHLMESNPIISRFYCTGVFFFALMYMGSDVLPLVKLLALTHRQQSYKYVDTTNEVVQSSILAPILPPSMICTLTHHDPKQFAAVFLGESETPEVMWGSAMRQHMISKIAAHISDFTPRLLSNIHTLYQYCPIGKIEYSTLKKELFCFEYYLRHLCDGARFPDWKIRDPVSFLGELLSRWKAELNKKPNTLSVVNCCEELEIPVASSDDGTPSQEVIRHAYLKLLPKYHPDKNPDGREKFERIQKAYEYLVSDRSTGEEESTRENLFLILRSQSILYQRCGEDLSSFKYAGFRPLLQLLKQELDDSAMFRKETVLVEAATELCSATLTNVALNADELHEEGGIAVLCSVLYRCFEQITPSVGQDDIHVKVAVHCVAALTVAAKLEPCRSAISGDTEMARILVSGMGLQESPVLLRLCVEATAVLCMHEGLQNEFVEKGALFHLMHWLFFYDATIEDADVELNENSHKQLLRNKIAFAALRAIFALSGIVSSSEKGGGHSTPVPVIHSLLETLLTPFMVKKFKQCESEGTEREILQLLTTNTDNPYFIWNNSTRAELKDSIEKWREDIRTGGATMSTIAEWCVSSFRYTAHKHMLCVGGVYIQSFLSQPKYPLENPGGLFTTLCHYMDAGQKGEIENFDSDQCELYTADHMRSVAKAMRLLLLSYPAPVMEAACASIESVLNLLTSNDEMIIKEALEFQEHAFSSQLFISSAEKTMLIPSRLGVLVSSTITEISEHALTVLELALSNRGIVEQSLHQRLYIALLRICLRDSSSQAQKDQSAHCLSTAFSDKLFGPELFHACHVFLPRVFLDSMKDNWRLTATLLCTWQENPELYWTESRKKRVEESLHQRLTEIIKRWSAQELTAVDFASEERVWELDGGETLSDLCVGGVYLQAYEKTPGWLVRNPKEFAIALIERFLAEAQPRISRTGGTACVQLPIVALVTSCALQLLNKSPHLADSVAPLGYTAKVVQLLKSQEDTIPETALRWLNALSRSSRCVESLSKQLVVRTLMEFIETHPQHSLLWFQTVDGIIAHANDKCTILQQALDFHLVEFLLDVLTDPSNTKISASGDPAVVRALITRAIKQLQRLPEPLYTPSLDSLLRSSPIWEKYKDHSHDMFLGNGKTTSGELIADAAPTLFLEAPQLYSSEPPAVK